MIGHRQGVVLGPGIRRGSRRAPGIGLAQLVSTRAPVRNTLSNTERELLRSLQVNPSTAAYGFSIERRGLQGRAPGAGRDQAGPRRRDPDRHRPWAIPVIDDLVIDTLAAHQAAGYPSPMMTSSYGPSGPSSGFGGYPSATTLYGSLPYTYPQPLFGRLDEPFYGFEPPAFSYPPWWGAMTAQPLGGPAGPAPDRPRDNNLPTAADPYANPAMTRPTAATTTTPRRSTCRPGPSTWPSTPKGWPPSEGTSPAWPSGSPWARRSLRPPG